MVSPPSRHALSRRAFLAGSLAGSGLLLTSMSGCSGGSDGGEDCLVTPATTPVDLGPSWAPKPVARGGLTCLATQDKETMRLHTISGDATFWSGVNLGSTTPGHSPGELAIPEQDYRRWFTMMRESGVRVLRIYTIHKPHMYAELKAHNEAHPDHPLYLMHGIYLPDESYLDSGDLYASGPTNAMIQETRDASAAVHGTLTRPPVRGRASGTWTADVSQWVLGWIVGVEWDPIATRASDAKNKARPAHQGAYFSSREGASPTERWVAARMDELATLEAAHGLSVPIAMVNWPTTDPLRHPQEPLEREDVVGVDANHIVASDLWPAGTFASYHAYPYYPDFQRLQPSYRQDPSGDAYRAYLLDLKRHHAGMPLMVTEFGVPSTLGSAHIGTNGRDQGHHTELEAMRMNSEMIRMFKDIQLCGGLLFAWTDEWFKFTWNTLPRHAVVDAERRALWHDVLTNEQYFGMIALDPALVGRRVVHEARDGLAQIDIDHDASWVHLSLAYTQALSTPVVLGFDVVPTAGRPLTGLGDSARFDIAVRVDPLAGKASCLIRTDLDPVLLDGLPGSWEPKDDGTGWIQQQLTLNRPYPIPGTNRERPPEMLAVGELIRTDDPQALRGRTGDTLSTWSLTDPGSDGLTRLQLRIPWGLLAISDPSSHMAVTVVDKLPKGVRIERIGVAVAGGTPAAATPVTFDLRWDQWNAAAYTERTKTGAQQYAHAMAETSRLA
ncbi:MAG: hypothetical protein Q4P32_03110 [Micrococcales bacterium]|nr:hypothetical protein [Micrococcales bacterium]